MDVTEKNRLLKTLARESVDRPAVICPGGMMSAAVTELLPQGGENHFTEAAAMAKAAQRVRDAAGFENLGVPFCMTVEAEDFGATVDTGSPVREARVTGYVQKPLAEMLPVWESGAIGFSRAERVAEAVSLLAGGDTPLIGNLTGPVSLATSLYEPVDILRLFGKNPVLLRRFLAVATDYLKVYARRLVRAGADVIALADPTATGEILGARRFGAFVVPLYRELVHALHAEGVPVILHICGKAGRIVEEMNCSGADALSFDAMVNLAKVKQATGAPVMGNVNTLLLASGRADAVKKATGLVLDKGVDIAAPACGIGMETPLANLRALTDTVRAAPHA